MSTFWPGWIASRWISSVFEPYSRAYSTVMRLGRQLAQLAHRHEARVELVRHRGAEDEAARLHADDDVDLLARVRLEHQVDRFLVGGRVLEQGGDVVEEDAGLREVGDLADLRAQLLGRHGIGTSIGRVRGAGERRRWAARSLPQARGAPSPTQDRGRDDEPVPAIRARPSMALSAVPADAPRRQQAAERRLARAADADRDRQADGDAGPVAGRGGPTRPRRSRR